MKRKELILQVSQALFNDVGESNVNSVDIANEMDISPGNLYYHFRGKEEIVAALVQRFSADINGGLSAGDDVEDTFMRRWQMVYGLLENIYHYRFFFRNIPDVRYNYPDSGKVLTKVLDQLNKDVTSFLMDMADGEQMAISSVQKNLISKLVSGIMMVIIYWESFETLHKNAVTETEYVQNASLQILSQLSPYINDEQIRDIHQCHQQYLRDKVIQPI